MKIRAQNVTSAFTLIEMMLAIALMSLVVAAIYSSWMMILRAKKVAVSAASSAQRERMAMRVMEEALTASQLFVANIGYYGFTNDSSVAGEETFSFVARLPKSFPRSGKFDDFDVRRVAFSLVSAHGGEKQLVMRQNPILMDMDDDEKTHPVVLAQNVRMFSTEYWDETKQDWTDEWLQTNQLPKLVRLSLQLNYVGEHVIRAEEVVTRIVGLPTVGVAQALQIPIPAGGNKPTSTNDPPQ